MDVTALPSSLLLSLRLKERQTERDETMKMLCKAARELGSFGADDCGAELVEWMLVTLVAGLAGYAVLVAVRDDLARVFEHVLGGFLDWLS